MHILVTADTVGGVWIYTRELVSGLVARGHRVTLVGLGRKPRPDQLVWLKALPSGTVDYYPTEFPLEWMQDAESGIEQSIRFVEEIIRKTMPDILHLNQYCYGSLKCGIPKIVVAHSDVISWWNAVYDNAPPPSNWFCWYAEVVGNGLKSADVVIAPSQWMLDRARGHFGFTSQAKVIYNGRNPALFHASSDKLNSVISVGRLWDQGKQIKLLLNRAQPVPVQIVGDRKPPDGTRDIIDLLSIPGVELLSAQSEADLCELFSRASAYVATSRYEPFGLAPVEAALSHCALILNDIPVFHELWGDAALYFRRNDPDALAEGIREISRNQRLRDSYADRAYERALSRFDSRRMVDEYEGLYYEFTSRSAAA